MHQSGLNPNKTQTYTQICVRVWVYRAHLVVPKIWEKKEFFIRHRQKQKQSERRKNKQQYKYTHTIILHARSHTHSTRTVNETR